MTKPTQKFIDFLKTQSIEEIASTMIELQREVDMLTSNHKPEPPTVIPLLSDYGNKKLHKDEDGKWALVLGDDHIRYLSIFECNFVDSAIAVVHGIKENT